MIRNLCKSGLKSRVTTVLGCQWGDEGKGKLVDILAENHDIVARFNGGSNAGHTLKVNDFKFAFHLLPCGMLFKDTTNIIGNGVVINIRELFEELEQLDDQDLNWEGRLMISERAHLTLEAHRQLDAILEKKQFLGTTLKGIGPTYALKCFRIGIRVGELVNWDNFVKKYRTFNDYAKDLFGIEIDQEEELSLLKEQRDILISKNMIVDSVGYLHDALNQNKRILTEGANALMLDLDFGTYPFVTSSNTSIGSISTGLSIPPNKIETVLGVVKAYTTRVGEGPFPSEIKGKEGEIMQRVGGEFGATTGRPRRCGWLDLAVVRYAHMINNLTSINLTKLDILSEFENIDVVTHYEKKSTGERVPYLSSRLEDWDDMRIVSTTLKGWKSDITKIKNYEDLPLEARDYINFIEEEIGVPVSWIGTGPDRMNMIRNPSCFE